MKTKLMCNVPPLQPEAFVPLPLGAVRPTGWLKEQLTIQAEGITGRLGEVWPDVGPKSAWLGGDGEAWERGPYYLDGLVPLAYLLDHAGLKAQAQRWLDWALDHQRADGWLGPTAGLEEHGYDAWPNAILLKALTQYHEATGDGRVLPVMERFCAWLREHLDEHPLLGWASYRWADLTLSIHWLYNRIGQDWLLDVAAKAQAQGYDWRGHFEQFQFTGKTPTDQCVLKTHVVNNAMAVKTPGVWFVQSGEAGDRAAVYRTLEMLDRYHGTVVGIFTGDEHYAGTDPSQGTELCAVVEYMFSLELLLGIFGDAAFADRLERIAYNAWPATFTPEMWGHQYDQQVNQVLCTIDERQWTNNGPDSNTFGLEPNFGCCTANLHQGWPKLVKHLWMATPDGGLAALVYGPCQVRAEAGGRPVTLTVDTIYPFGEDVTVSVQGAGRFPLVLRVPGWAKGATASVNGEAVDVGERDFLRLEREWCDGDRIELHFPMTIAIEERGYGAAAVRRGPLVYSLKMGEDFRRIKGEPPAVDWAVHPTTRWNYGLLVDSENPADSFDVTEAGEVGRVPFDPAAAPVTLKTKGRRVAEWTLEQHSAGPLPQSPVTSEAPLEDLTLIPYGSTHLRVTEFPRLKS